MRQQIKIRSLPARNEAIRSWLKARDLFNLAAIARRINYDRSNFSQFLEGHRDLVEPYISSLEMALEPYGY